MTASEAAGRVALRCGTCSEPIGMLSRNAVESALAWVPPLRGKRAEVALQTAADRVALRCGKCEYNAVAASATGPTRGANV